MFSQTHLVVAVFFAAAASYVYLNKESLVREKLLPKYDYVIVGAGAAGCVLANRLSEDVSVNVLLLEAGDEETSLAAIDVPLSAAETYGTSVDWQDMSTPQDHACLGMKHNRCPLSRGKVLGGSTSTNAMVYLRGSRHSFDLWGSQPGSEGWSFADLLPYFKMSEANQNEAYVKSGYHGDTGPIVVKDNHQTTIGDAFLASGADLGYSETDLDGDKDEGVQYVQANVNNGRRWGTAKAYLRPAMVRHNLHVATHAQVTKILIYNGRALGVEFTRNGAQRWQVGASREVIVSAGAIGSPQLLLLSGIGPKDQLNQMGINVEADLPVGENLIDHMMLFDAVRYTLPPGLGLTVQKALAPVSQLQYFLFGQGPLSSNQFVDGTGSFRVPSASGDEEPPSIGIGLSTALLGHYAEANPYLLNGTNILEKVFSALYGGLDEQEGMDLMLYFFQPLSRGTVRLKSRDAHDLPLVDPNYLTDQRDVAKFIEGIRIAERIASGKPFKSLGAKPLVRKHPLCEAHPYGGNAYWECFVRHHAGTLHHYMGTCKMGAPSDATTVVDNTLRVKGIDSLRVADASVIPIPISGGPMAASIMIGEKAARLILDDL